MAYFVSELGAILQVSHISVVSVQIKSSQPHPFVLFLVEKIEKVFISLLYIYFDLFSQLAYVLFGILGGPLLGLFTFGMLCPWGNKWVLRFFYEYHFFSLLQRACEKNLMHVKLKRRKSTIE